LYSFKDLLHLDDRKANEYGAFQRKRSHQDRKKYGDLQGFLLLRRKKAPAINNFLALWQWLRIQALKNQQTPTLGF
jgi:hypothetical protein